METGLAHSKEALKVNLGCGRFPKAGFVNVDWDKASGAEVIHNLNTLPYPFKNDTIAELEADHVLEHLGTAFDIMKELHRVLKPGGKLTVRVPHFSRGLTHPEHQRGFDFTFPYYFNPTFKGGYTGTHFELASMKMRWFTQPYLKRTVMNPLTFYIGLFMGEFLSFFANLSPAVCSRIWCFWVGGFEEIEFVLKKPLEPLSH